MTDDLLSITRMMIEWICKNATGLGVIGAWIWIVAHTVGHWGW